MRICPPTLTLSGVFQRFYDLIIAVQIKGTVPNLMDDRKVPLQCVRHRGDNAGTVHWQELF